MLRNFLIWLFATEGKPGEIAFLGIWHLLYAFIIFGSTIALGIFISKKSESAKEKLLRTLAYAAVIVYVLDFFIQPLMNGGADEMNVDKLPFHICTVLCPVLAFVQFNKKFAFLKEPVAILSIVGPMMYIVYPGTAIGDISPVCYQVIQTFVYHGLVFSWGFNMLATGKVKPCIKSGWWKVLAGIVLIAGWASLGNFSHDGYNWFFLMDPVFPFIPKAINPIAVIVAIFGMSMIIYGLYYAVMAIKRSINKKGATEEKKEEATV